MSDLSSKHNCWLSWFDSRISADVINKSNQKTLFTTFNASVGEDQCIEALKSYHETAFLHKAVVGENRVAIFHHFIEVGGSLYDASEKEYGFFQGIGNLTTTAMTPDVKTLKRIVSDDPIQVPTITSLFKVTNNDQLAALAASTRISFRPQNFVPIPPFLLDSVNQAIVSLNGNAATVLLKTIKAIKEFNSSHADDDEFVDKAKTKCSNFVHWLFLVYSSHNSIKGIPVVGCSSKKISLKLTEITSKEIPKNHDVAKSISEKVELSLKRPFEVLAATSSSTTDFMEKLTQLQSQNSDKCTKSFKKIPQKYQNMILVASSVSEVTELDYQADGSNFFKCSSTLNTLVMLNSLLETEGIECSVSAAVATALLYGSFLWKDSLSPSGFAASVLTSEGVL